MLTPRHIAPGRWRATASAALAAALGIPLAHADEPPCDEACRNRAIAAEWARQSGQPLPQVSTGAQGQRQLQWHGSAGVQLSHQQVAAGAPGAANTPALPGAHRTLNLRGELNLPELHGESGSLQLAAQASSDRSVAPDHAAQVQNLSVAYQGPAWSLQLGDHAASFSQLGLQLGYRGVHAQHKVGMLTLAMLAGTLADSWNSLANRRTLSGRPARSRYLRDLAGLYVGADLGPRWRAFATASGHRDRADSLPEPQRQEPLVHGGSLALGLQYRGERLALALEAARSQARSQAPPALAEPRLGDGLDADDDTSVTRASALVLDASYRFDSAQLRAGLRRVGTVFTAAGGSGVQPGSQELFVSADGQPRPWLQWTADLRSTVLRSAATGYAPAGRSTTERAQLGANLTLNAWVPGLSAQWQASRSQQRAQQGAATQQGQASLSLNWQRPEVGLGLVLNQNTVRTPGVAGTDSQGQGLQVQVSRPFGQGRPVAGFSGQLGLTAGVQRQHLQALQATARNRTLGLSASAQRQGLGQFSATLQWQDSAPPLGGPLVRQRQWQLDALHPLAERTELKLSARWAWHNLGSAAALGQERRLGLELQTRW